MILGLDATQNAIAGRAIYGAIDGRRVSIHTNRPADTVCLVRQAAETLKTDVICTVDPDGTVGVRLGRFGRKTP